MTFAGNNGRRGGRLGERDGGCRHGLHGRHGFLRQRRHRGRRSGAGDRHRASSGGPGTAAPLADRTGSAAPSRWDLEAAYGFPAFGGRFTGSPHFGVGLAAGSRAYSLGWRLTPEATSTTNLTVDLTATRQERDAAIPAHTVGVEITAQW